MNYKYLFLLSLIPRLTVISGVSELFAAVRLKSLLLSPCYLDFNG